MPKSNIDNKMRVFVHLPYGLDAQSYRERYLNGNEPDETPYCFHLAENLGCSVLFSKDILEKKRNFARKFVKKIIGLDLLHLFFNRKQIMQSDIVWTMLENEWLSLRFMALFFKWSRLPVVGNSVWLFNNWDKIGYFRKAFYGLLAIGPGILTTHSDRYLSVMAKAFPKANCKLMHFGTNAKKNTPIFTDGKIDRPVRLLAAGTDSTRDWSTLLEALGNDTRVEIKLICQWLTSDTRSKYSSLLSDGIEKKYNREQFDQLYQWCDFVIIPMFENKYSGITVAIESAAQCKPIISSRTGGVPTYFNEDEVFFVTPENRSELIDAVFSKYHEKREKSIKAYNRFWNSDYSSLGMISRYLKLSKSLFDTR